jgi:hypothetical protein
MIVSKPKEVEVRYVPFPSEEAREEAYCKWVKAFLSAKMRRLRQEKLSQEKQQGE